MDGACYTALYHVTLYQIDILYETINNVRLFVDGVEVTSRGAKNRWDWSNDESYLGRRGYSASLGHTYFDGVIEKFMIYDDLLTQEEIKEVTKRMLNEIKNRLNSKNINIEFTDSVINRLSEKGFDKVYGARPLRRLITTEIEDMLSEKFLSGELNKEKYIIDYQNNNFFVKEKSLV